MTTVLILGLVLLFLFKLVCVYYMAKWITVFVISMILLAKS